MGASGTMDVDADGTLDVHMVLDGGTIDQHLTLEKGTSGNGYTLYDNGQVFGALEYDKNGPVNWLILFVPIDNAMYGFTFYQKD